MLSDVEDGDANSAECDARNASDDDHDGRWQLR
jgi:hypothetical protein